MRWLVFLLISPVMWAACTPASGYSFCATLTQVHTQNGSTNSASFPVGVIGTANGTGTGAFASSNVDLRTTGNGGKIQNTVTGFLYYATYTSGITAVGTAGQTCLLSSFNQSLSGATASVALTGVNTIAANTVFVITGPGSGAVSLPNSATAATGTATSCSGTASFKSVVSFVTVPADLIVTSDSAGTTKIPWEVASYSASTGAIQIFINESISHTVDTLAYISFGNAAVTTWQGNVTGTWNSAFITVLHYESVLLTTGKLTFTTDSTTNFNHLANPATDVTNGSGLAGLGQLSPAPSTNASSLIGSGANSSGFNNYPSGSSARTMELWINKLGLAFNGVDAMGGWGGGSASTGVWWNMNGCAAGPGFTGCSGTNDVLYNTANAGQRYTTLAQDSNWHHFAMTLPSGTTVNSILGYLDGSLQTTTVYGSGTTINTGTTNLTIGGSTGQNGNTFQGGIDEVRVSNVARSADWILATYNNFNAPGSFVTVSNAGSGTPPPPFGIINQ